MIVTYSQSKLHFFTFIQVILLMLFILSTETHFLLKIVLKKHLTEVECNMFFSLLKGNGDWTTTDTADGL